MPRDVRAPSQVATIDVVLVVLETQDGDLYGIDTANQVEVEKREETVAGTVLNPKGILRAQKLEEVTPTGYDITISDNLFSGEITAILQGGMVMYDLVDGVTFKGYRPPQAGSRDKGEVFTLHVYTAQYDTAGLVVQYERTKYPSCRGRSVALNSEDGAFRAPEYAIVSAPSIGEYLFELDCVPELPIIIGQVPLARLTVTSVAGTSTGDTDITVTPTAVGSNTYMYLSQASVIPLPVDMQTVTGYTEWDGATQISATTGHYIAIVEVTADGRAVAGGQTTVTSA